MRFLWVVVVAAVVIQVSSEISNKRMNYGPQSGPLCWGPGTWPHPQHCRLFTICQLKYEVKGQLFVCPDHSGFSPKHLRCIPDVLIPGCQQSAPLDEDSLDLSTAVKLDHSEGSDKPTTDSPCDQEAAPFCQDGAILVLCGPNNKYMGTVNCTSQRQGTTGYCDKVNKSCFLIHTTTVPADITESTPTSTELPISTTFTDSSVETDPETTDSAEEADETMLAEATLNDEGQASTLNNNNNDNNNNNSNDTTNDNASLSSEESQPTLPPNEEITCLIAGLQCHDNVTIIDCPEDLSEPNFVMSCANIITSNDSIASGYCDNELPSCMLLVDNVVMNLEISTFDFGDLKNPEKENEEDEYDELDDDYVGPEMYDSDLLRESTGIFDALSWFRNGPNGQRFDGRSSDNHDENQKGTDGKLEKMLENRDIFVEARRIMDEEIKSNTNMKETKQMVKLPKVIKVPSGSDELLTSFLEKCNKGGLYCFDNTTLVACSGDPDTPTYAIQCYGQTPDKAQILEAYCDGYSNSCVVNLVDNPATTTLADLELTPEAERLKGDNYVL